VTQAPDPVLVVPTHANLELPLNGRVLQSAAERFGFTYNSYEPMLVPQPGFGTFRVHNKGRFPGEELLLVRIPGPYSINDKEQPISVYRRALRTLFGSLAALELRTDRLKSMALPLLGGTRGYEIKDLMRAIDPFRCDRGLAKAGRRRRGGRGVVSTKRCSKPEFHR
jgi:hypothetical protein